MKIKDYYKKYELPILVFELFYILAFFSIIFSLNLLLETLMVSSILIYLLMILILKKALNELSRGYLLSFIISSGFVHQLVLVKMSPQIGVGALLTIPLGIFLMSMLGLVFYWTINRFNSSYLKITYFFSILLLGIIISTLIHLNV